MIENKELKTKNQERSSLRVAFLTPMPSPYIQDLFKQLVQLDGLDVRVLYMEMGAPNTFWGKRSLEPFEEVLPGGGKEIAGGRLHFNFGALRRIKALSPDLLVVSGYSGLTLQTASWWARFRGIPLIYWGEVPGIRRGRGVSILRKLAMWGPLGNANGIVGIGRKASTVYRNLTHGKVPVANIPYTTAIAPFLARSSATRNADSAKYRQSVPFRILYCGQLIHRKGVDLLCDAVLSLRDSNANVKLILVGKGELENHLMEKIPKHHRAGFEFCGFQSVDRLPEYFADADVFVLPSRHDGWGVVVNQAMAAGLPVIASSAVGASSDMIRNAAHGRIFDSENVDQLTDQIESIRSDWLGGKCLSKEPTKQALRLSPEAVAKKWAAFIRFVANRSTPLQDSDAYS